MRVDTSIVAPYLDCAEVSAFSGHWVYRRIVPGFTGFAPLPPAWQPKMRAHYAQVLEVVDAFVPWNEALLRALFPDVTETLRDTKLLFTVDLPPIFDAFAMREAGEDYIITDLTYLHDCVRKGKDLTRLLHGMLTHELVHVLINRRYYQDRLAYEEYFDYVAFQEGFAHVLAMQPDVQAFRPDETHRAHFQATQATLRAALQETDEDLRVEYTKRANAGPYWQKFAAISAMLYLSRQLPQLGELYEAGWHGFAGKVAAYSWEPLPC